MLDRSEALYWIGEIRAKLPILEENERTAKTYVEIDKKQLADHQTQLADIRDKLATLNDSLVELLKFAEDVLDEPEAVQVFKDLSGYLTGDTYDFNEHLFEYRQMKKALSTISAGYNFSDREQAIDLTDVPQSYREFIYGVSKDDTQTTPASEETDPNRSGDLSSSAAEPQKGIEKTRKTIPGRNAKNGA